jgi:hypothetical protein
MGRLPFRMGTARLEDDLLYKSKHSPSLLQYVLYVEAIQVRHLAHWICIVPTGALSPSRHLLLF